MSTSQANASNVSSILARAYPRSSLGPVSRADLDLARRLLALARRLQEDPAHRLRADHTGARFGQRLVQDVLQGEAKIPQQLLGLGMPF